MWNHRTECTTRPCASLGNDTTKTLNIILCRQMKGRVAIWVHKKLRQKPYWGNQFWVKSYCVDMVGLDGEMIRKYVKYQEENERRVEQQKLF